MNAPTTDRTDLILAAQTGDAGSIERLLAVCQADARRYARRHCHVSDVDDAVQEALLTISRKVNGLKAAAAFSSRLFVAIKHECRRLERLMFRHEPLPEDLAEEQMLNRPDASLHINLARALGSLPAHCLDVVLLRDFEEFTSDAIAHRLGEKPGAVKSRLHRARLCASTCSLSLSAHPRRRRRNSRLNYQSPNNFDWKHQEIKAITEN